MKVILVSKHNGRTRSFNVNLWMRGLLSLLVVGSTIGSGAYLYQYRYVLIPSLADNDGSEIFNDVSGEAWQAWNENLRLQKQEVETTRRQAEEKLSALTLRVAELQARIVRLDALGERLTTIAKLDQGEFDFSQAPALGGPETADLGKAYQAPDFLDVIDNLTNQIEDREHQLETLEALLAKQKIQSDIFIAGRPVKKGWMSSRYGRRTDPFNGNVAWHQGVDFAGKENADVISVAAGVVTWAAQRHGYGLMVEVNHGGGFSTRYAHNNKNLVKVGDVVKKGQVVALMGSSGRSTGPHLHFEVRVNGSHQNPLRYVR